MNQRRLETLLDRYFDEALTEAERTELESLLLTWPQARELFWKRARFNSLLRRRGREVWGHRLAASSLQGGEPRKTWRDLWAHWCDSLRPIGWWAAAGLAVMLIAFLILGPRPGWYSNTARSREAGQPITNMVAAVRDGQGVATILRALDVEWTGNSQRPGNVLGPGWLKFNKGLVEIQFHRGARVVVEGPAEFELMSDMQARCVFGKVSAEVPPPATGFEILSPRVRVVDRGTAFGLDVERDGLAEVHVFSGKVDLSTTAAPANLRELVEGKAVRVDLTGALNDIPTSTADFTTVRTIESRANATMATRYAAWANNAATLRTDPSLLMQYSFDDEAAGSRVLANHALGATRESQGTIIGCSWTEGRWPGKKAIDFKQAGDRIRFALPREYEAMTCVTSIRLDAMDRPYSALLMSGDAVVGELQWQVSGNGSMRFGKRKTPGWGYGKLVGADSQPVIEPQRCGSWMQLAFVYDARAKTFTHYVDGEAVVVRPMDGDIPLRTGALEIGNWTPAGGDPVEPIRAFNGRMDEFLVFSRALKAEEIQRLWKIGRPL